MHIRPLLLGAMLCGGLSRLGVSQAHPVLTTLPPKADLRVQLVDSTVVVGRLAELDPSRIRLNTIVRPTATDSRLVPRTVPLDSIARAWVGEGTYWKRGALIGFGLGTLAMYVLVHTVPDDGCGAEWGCAAGAIIMGGLPGAALGAVAGHQAVRWRLLF